MVFAENLNSISATYLNIVIKFINLYTIIEINLFFVVIILDFLSYFLERASAYHRLARGNLNRMWKVWSCQESANIWCKHLSLFWAAKILMSWYCWSCISVYPLVSFHRCVYVVWYYLETRNQAYSLTSLPSTTAKDVKRIAVQWYKKGREKPRRYTPLQ